MYSDTLIPTDGSDASTAVLDHALTRFSVSQYRWFANPSWRTTGKQLH